MNYWVRIGGALAVSLVINLALLTALPHLIRDSMAVARTEPTERAIRLDFRPPEPAAEPEPQDAPKQLIEAGAETDGPVAETDLISSANTRAQDNSEAEGDPSKPAVDEVDEFDQLQRPPTPPEAPAVPPAEQMAAEPPAPKVEPEAGPQPPPATPKAVEDVGSKTIPSAVEPSPPTPPRDKVAVAPLEELKPPAEKEEQPPERFQVAQAAPPPSPKVPVQELQASRGREQGGSLNSGFTSFEANKHELGEYMLHVRSLVEREWRGALRLRYAGVSRTDALIKCSIRPDGTLEYARVIDPGSSLTYAVLCRQAIEQAAPFGPFPFEVPDIYRNENLEITWKFSYL